MTDDRAHLAVLLESTGLSQSEAARFIGVQDRTVRRWLDGERPVPADVIARLKDLAEKLDRAANEVIKLIDESPRWTVLLIYRRDDDLPPWAGAPTSSCHLALIRRVFERREGTVELIMFDPDSYCAWRKGRADNQRQRDAWAAHQVLSVKPLQQNACINNSCR